MFNLKNIACWLAFITISFTVKAQVKDTLYFRNGSILVGLLKSISLGKAVFDDDNMDILNIKLTKIRALVANTHIYRMETINGKTYYTTLDLASEGRALIRDGDNQMVEIPFEDIRNLVPLSGTTGALWRGNASLGYSYSKSSGVGQLNSNFSLEYLAKKFEMQLSGSTIFNQTDSSTELSNASSGVVGSYLITPVWEASLFLAYQRNLEQGLSRRFQEGMGGGANLFATEYTRMKAITGVVFNQERSVEGTTSPTQVDVPVLVNFSFFKFSKPDMTVTLKENVFFGITQKGRIRQDGQFSLNVKVVQDFYINLQFYHNYDNQPPGENSQKIDYGVVFGLTYKFSQ
ncbi:MAG TPA: DUF481 domain-containing protein [Flavisolibacter sp.]